MARGACTCSSNHDRTRDRRWIAREV